jgi:hypothetical protein
LLIVVVFLMLRKGFKDNKQFSTTGQEQSPVPNPAAQQYPAFNAPVYYNPYMPNQYPYQQQQYYQPRYYNPNRGPYNFPNNSAYQQSGSNTGGNYITSATQMYHLSI